MIAERLYLVALLAASIWMYRDASRLGYDKRDLRGLHAIEPWGWLLGGLFLWPVTLPLYLMKRGELKAAGERRRRLFGGPATGQRPHGAHDASPLNDEQVAQGVATLARLRDECKITAAVCQAQQAQLIGRRR